MAAPGKRYWRAFDAATTYMEIVGLGMPPRRTRGSAEHGVMPGSKKMNIRKQSGGNGQRGRAATLAIAAVMAFVFMLHDVILFMLHDVIW